MSCLKTTEALRHARLQSSRENQESRRFGSTRRSSPAGGFGTFASQAQAGQAVGTTEDFSSGSGIGRRCFAEVLDSCFFA